MFLYEKLTCIGWQQALCPWYIEFSNLLHIVFLLTSVDNSDLAETRFCFQPSSGLDTMYYSFFKTVYTHKHSSKSYVRNNRFKLICLWAFNLSVICYYLYRNSFGINSRCILQNSAVHNLSLFQAVPEITYKI